MLHIYSQIKVVVENLVYSAVRCSSTKQQQGVKYFYDEQYKWIAPIYLLCVSLYILLYIMLDDVFEQITWQK